MTHVIISAATIFLFLCLSPLTSTADTTAVLDINGRPLQAGCNYYILPVIRGRGGGLTMTSKNATELCPLYVAQEDHEVSNGLPLKFYPVNPKDKRISLSSDLNFVFDAATTCVQSTGWSLTIEMETGRRYVGTGGEIGNPGVETVDNWFKIEKDGSGKYYYKIVYCPGVCNFCKVMCGDVGVFIEKDGRRLLGFSDQPLLVMFKKA
ncbi:kunitz trypsin inhibitor 5 [Beta vulgaris subsp. vulgaris]|uniref:kunitz trypsin inhibitor 5 n=1 Tax=Beta vulgaris subsp. vulgaris TaxID=3555 RepID=UPI0020373B1D|nr:kunitz trypsin inhibitor 5 [Beta vulgaris subsp. vulgaris]